MRRFWWVLAALLLGSGAVAFVVGHRRQPEWTTSSQEALREFRKGLEAEMKYYQDEALEHYRAASELDPEFAMAKLKSLQWTKRDGDGKETIARLGDELRKFDLDRLNERERFLLSYRIARLDKENAKAEKLLTAYLAGHPEDPWALSIRCAQAWDRQDWPTVERCDRKLLTADPNWVRAQNDLGYIAMAQGRFEDAEEMFRTYLFVAPDQPNPHDSLGELLTLRGRYDEAAQQFEEALRIRPDFCASWAHWLLSAQLAGDDGQAEEVMRRAQEAGTCDASYLQQHRCALDIWVPLAKGDAAAAYEADDGKDVVAERIGFDERFADAVLDLVVGPAHGHAGGDDGAHRGAAGDIEGQPRLAQRTPLAQEVPALVEGDLDRLEPAAVAIGGDPVGLAPPELVLLRDQLLDSLADLLVVHA